MRSVPGGWRRSKASEAEIGVGCSIVHPSARLRRHWRATAAASDHRVVAAAAMPIEDIASRRPLTPRDACRR